MKSLPLFAFLIAACSVFGQQTDPKLKGIEKELQQVLKDQQCAGFAVAVVKGNEVVYLQGFGYRDMEKKLPVTPNTMFAIGSSSKAFTASLMGILQERGKLKLDDKACKYLPAMTINDPTRAQEITIRDMMCHRTGLPRYDYSWYLFNSASKDSLFARLAYMKPTAGLREMWQYNNFMFLGQGLIAEKITGTTWEENILKEFFMPLGMKRSNTSLKGFTSDADASLPYTVSKSGVIEKMDYFDISGMSPAGSINSTASDLSNWLKVWVNGGKFKSAQIIPTAYYEEAISSQMVMGSGLPAKFNDLTFSNYGLGWMVHSYRGHYQVEHGGNIDGFSANVAFFPTDSIGIVVLTNQDGSSVPKIVRNIIADRLLGMEYRDWNGTAKKEADEANKASEQIASDKEGSAVKNTTPSHDLSAYTGSFNNPAYGTIEISNGKNGLQVQIGKYKAKLTHYHYDYFTVEKLDSNQIPVEGLKLSFDTGIDGKIADLKVQFDATGEVVFEHKDKPVAISNNDLQKYVGDYDLSGTIVTVSVKNNILYVFVPGQTDYSMTFVGNHSFNLDVAKGYSVVFEVNANNVAESMSFVQPNGTFKAKKK